ncbi:YggT family protein [Desulfococcaceae bacterium HSG8]|nr:YggT family protein [Desulfococcaceae bacterium HSG8]
MFILGYFIEAVAVVLEMVLYMYMLILLAKVLLSWVNPDPYNPIVRFLDSVTEPVLFRIRKTIPVVYGGIDFSPIIVLIAIAFLRSFLVRVLYKMASSFV